MAEPLHWLRAFEAAARLGSLTAAAREAGLTQAAVSQQIKALESRLGVSLLLRRPRGVELTGAGAELYADVSRGLSFLDGALGRFSSPVRTVLRISCNASLAIRWLQPRLAGFREANPGVRLQLRSALWPGQSGGLRPDADIFLARAGAVAGTGAVPVLDGTVTGFGSPSSAADAPLIAMTAWDFFEGQPDTSRAAFEVDSCDAALSLAEQGAGIAAAPRILAANAVREGRLMEVPLPYAVRPMEYCLCFSGTAGSTVQEFCAWVRAQGGADRAGA
jgi:DNA-binding transcriptional LysR family regulator